MRYLLALLFPPLGILLCGKPFQAILCFFLTLCFWFPGALYALLVTSNWYADRRIDRLAKATVGATQAMAAEVRAQTKVIKAASKAASKAATVTTRSSLPDPIPDQDQHQDPVAREPWITRESIANAKASLVSIKSESIRAYQNLPEWAHPITWGLAAGSAIAVPLMLFMIAKRV